MFKKHSQISAPILPTSLDPHHAQNDSDLTLPAPGLGRRKLLRRVGYSLAGLSASLSLPSSLVVAAAPTSTAASGNTTASSTHADAHFDPNAQPKGPTTSPLTFTQTFAGYDFRPAVSGTTYSLGFTGGIYWTGTGDPDFWLRLDLPQGSKVTNLTCFITDSDSSNNLSVKLVTLSPVTRTLNSVVSLTSSGTFANPQTLSQAGTPAAPLATIDNASYSYQLIFIPTAGNSNHTLWGAQISYTNVLGRFQAA